MPNTGTLAGLSPGTDYVLDAVHVDTWGNVSAVASSAPFTTPASSGTPDGFDRADEPLEAGASWTQVAAQSISADVVGNRLRVTSTAGFQICRYTYDVTPGDDQYLQFTWQGTTAGGTHIYDFFVRLSVSGTQFTGYGLQYQHNNGGMMVLKRWTNDAETDLGSSINNVLSPGDVVRIEAQGTTIRVRVNSAEVLSRTDSAHASGRSGFRGITDAGYTELDDWETGDL